MARTKNAKRVRVEGESSTSARLVASSYYMARWLPSPRALNNYLEKFELRTIVPPRAVYSTLNYVVPETDEDDEEVMPLFEFDLGSRHYRVTLEQLAEQWNLVYHGAKFTRGIVVDEEWSEYNRLVGLQSLQYEDLHMDARENIVLWALVTGKKINWPYFMVHHMLEMKRGKSSVGLGYACQWTKIFKWLGIDLSEEKSIVLSNRQDR
ncbi:hypothetical protein S83_022740 [Arachis hypogaea]